MVAVLGRVMSVCLCLSVFDPWNPSRQSFGNRKRKALWMPLRGGRVTVISVCVCLSGCLSVSVCWLDRRWTIGSSSEVWLHRFCLRVFLYFTKTKHTAHISSILCCPYNNGHFQCGDSDSDRQMTVRQTDGRTTDRQATPFLKGRRPFAGHPDEHKQIWDPNPEQFPTQLTMDDYEESQVVPEPVPSVCL